MKRRFANEILKKGLKIAFAPTFDFQGQKLNNSRKYFLQTIAQTVTNILFETLAKTC